MHFCRVLFCLVAGAWSLSAVAADWSINGTVLEKGTRKPMQGVVVSVQEHAAINVVSDVQGQFRLVFPAAGDYTLVANGPSAVSKLAIHLDEATPVPSPIFYLMPPQTLKEVVVRAERSPDRVSKSVISGKTMGHVAGSSGDPLRALQTLPGVVAAGGSSAPAVRGSGPGDNLYYVDGLLIGKLFHFGSISVFNADLVDDFNLYGAAFSPHYGDVTGAVIDVALREPRKDRLGGKLNVSMMGADALVEGPIGQDQSFYFAARRSYIDLFLKQVSQQGVSVQIPNYWDYQGKYLLKVNDNNRLTLQMHGASDVLKLSIDSTSNAAQREPTLAGTAAFSDRNAMQGLTLDTVLDGDAINTLAVEHMYNNASNVLGSVGTQYTSQDTYRLHEQMRKELDAGHEISLGADYSKTTINVDADFLNARCTQFNPNCSLSTAVRQQLTDSFSTDAWSVSLQDRKRVMTHVTLVGGVRHSVENYSHRAFNEPRIGAEWEWSEQTLLTAGWGRHNQQPSGGQWIRQFGNPKLDHIRAEHSVVGIAHKVDKEWNWKAEAYYKNFDNLVVNDPLLNYINAASGKAYGLELLIKKEEIEKLSGWFVLNLTKSQRRNDVTGEEFRFQYDEPVNATLVGNYKLTDAWNFGAKWNIHSGAPYTPIIGTNGNYPDGRPIPVYGGVNSASLPVYHRLDLRADRIYVFDTWKLNAYFEVNNAYMQKNITGYRYDATYTSKEPVYGFVLPFSFGVQGEF